MPRPELVRWLLSSAINGLHGQAKNRRFQPFARGQKADRRKNDPLPVFVVCRALMAAQWEMAVRKTSKLIFAAAALAATMSFNIPAGHAAGWRHEPWCAFFEYDDVTVDCSYRTFEECYPNVIGGIRGTCGPNPDGPGVSAAAPAEAHKQHKHRAQQ
jgi:hypothetical protein